MVNFGLSHLRMVKGPEPDHPEVRMMGVKAAHVLDATVRTGTLDEALRDMTFIVGTTARRRERLPTVSARQAASRILQEAARGRVGILFGREDSGLTSEELRKAHEVIAVEVSPDCRALNVSQAVLLVAYELYLAAEAQGGEIGTQPGRLVTAEMLAHLQGDLIEALEILGIVHAGTRTAHTQSLERLLARNPIQTRDARVLFALARRIIHLKNELLPFRAERDE
jgi:TrmH family RNA methyltransferase